MTSDNMRQWADNEMDRQIAEAIRRGECPFGQLREGQTFAHCPLGFPGCGCADELLLNPQLEKEREAAFAVWEGEL